MEANNTLPDMNRFSIVTALSSLMLGLTFALPPSGGQNSAAILGVIFNFEINLYAFFPLLIALIASTGSIWVLRSHPQFADASHSVWSLLPNVILPALSIFILSFTLREMARSNVWWVVYVLGSLLFGLVLTAEYNVLDLRVETHPAASLGLIGLSHALFLILSVVLRTGRMRLYVVVPLIVLAAMFITLRSINLRTQGRWHLEYALIVSLLVGQLAVSLHYFFLNPLQYGILLTSALYILISVICGIIQRLNIRELLVEPALMLILSGALLILAGAI
ncbi:MAG TPA: hypothetical protein PKW57_00560 [Anaerolineaceae bacterium]|jgi:hypothetical protein|nr:hypothetical protein [Anaerolineaceae bacterium]